jgi:hypothetical protein
MAGGLQDPDSVVPDSVAARIKAARAGTDAAPGSP